MNPTPRPRRRGAWICRCHFPDGRVEESQWWTEDGADQMASEMETHEGAVCEVEQRHPE
jgi:hypothetical protein